VQGCNATQIAASMGICVDTLYNRCPDEHGVSFSVFAQQKRAVGDELIHKKQFQRAIKDGNIQMLLHLGKYRLGQKDTDLEDLTKKNTLVQALLDEIMRMKNPKEEAQVEQKDETT